MSSLKDKIVKEVARVGEDGTVEKKSKSPKGLGLSAKVEKATTKLKSYVVDLRIHAPTTLNNYRLDGLDPAPAMVRVAKVKGIDVIAVTDFYSVKFVERVLEAAHETSVTVLPGVMIRCNVASCNDVTIACLFKEGTPVEHVREFLQSLGVPPEAAGRSSYILDKSLSEILALVEQFAGIAIPSRMDKTPQRKTVIPILVEEYGFRAFDLAYGDSAQFFKRRFPKVKFRLFSFSSADALAQIGSRSSKVKLGVPGFEGIKQLVERAAI